MASSEIVMWLLNNYHLSSQWQWLIVIVAFASCMPSQVNFKANEVTFFRFRETVTLKYL